ncbi:MAG: hypothetical protein P8X42_01845, partial [Calditrichaceae bacterium]
MKIFIGLLLCVILIGCLDKDQTETSKADSTKTADSLQNNLMPESDIIAIAPEWFKKLPEKNGFLYASALGKSQRNSIADSKAMMKAQVILAEKLKNTGEYNNIQRDHLSLGADKDPVDNDMSVTLKNVIVKDKKRIKAGKLWYSFVLV